MAAYLYSTKIWRFHDGAVPGDGGQQFVIGKTAAEAAKKVDAGTRHINYAGTLLITKADMHVIFDPPPPQPTPVDSNAKVVGAGPLVEAAELEKVDAS